MSTVNLFKALRIPASPKVAFVGAGGKTTGLFQLARELDTAVVVTATTHLSVHQIPLADRHIIADRPGPIEALEHSLSGIILITGQIKSDRTQPLNNNLLGWLRQFCGYHSLPLLIEADGSRQKPIKGPAEHEPPIPNFVKLVVYVAGLKSLGKPLSAEHVHRPGIFSQLSGLRPGEIITSEALQKVLTHPQGGLKNIPNDARRIVLLNQADTPQLQAQGSSIARDLHPTFDAAILSCLQKEEIHAVYEPTAGIILAAGQSRRFGTPKQLLEWRGEPFIRVIAKTALAAGLAPVCVVTGSHADQIEGSIQDLPVQIAYNKEWKSGQASSIKAGLAALGSHPGSLNARGIPGAAIFLLADQPQVTPTILHALCAKHAASLAEVIAPMIIDQRGNPVLFDRRTFRELLKLEGDSGGRAIFSRYKLSYLPWHDDGLLLDVDTPEQYRRLKELME